MKQSGFHALFHSREKRDAFDALFDGTRADSLHVEVVTKSGRTFRYEVADIRFGSDITHQSAAVLAEKILADKYRYCAWDKRHPAVVAETEITAELVKLIMDAAEQMRNESSEEG